MLIFWDFSYKGNTGVGHLPKKWRTPRHRCWTSTCVKHNDTPNYRGVFGR